MMPTMVWALAAEEQRRAEHLGVAAEAALPEAVAQDDDVDVRAARAVERNPVFAVAERAAEHRLDAEHAEQIGGDARAEHALGLLRAGDVEIGDVAGDGDLFERVLAIAPVAVQRAADRHSRETRFHVRAIDAGEPVWFARTEVVSGRRRRRC